MRLNEFTERVLLYLLLQTSDICRRLNKRTEQQLHSTPITLYQKDITNNYLLILTLIFRLIAKLIVFAHKF